jgi:anthranilate phosphoribosyltransferase
MITPQAALNRLIDGQALLYDEMVSLMHQIMSGQVTPVQLSAILIGLRVQGESVSDVAAAAFVMRELVTPVPVRDRVHLVDTCGTGGDGAKTFNISTCAALVAAAAGAKVAKHGGRSVSSGSGSADVLEALGVNINLTAAQVGQAIDEIGIGFMFGRNFHGGMRYVAPVRQELGVRTLFNIVAPLVNPAGAANQLIGVFHPDLVGLHARVLHQLGSQHVMIVHGRDGLDEITLTGETLVAECQQDAMHEYTIRPSQFGLQESGLGAITALDATQSAAMLLAVLENAPGPARDIVVLNAGAALYVCGKAPTLATGIERARDVIASGAAKDKLHQLRDFSNQYGGVRA